MERSNFKKRLGHSIIYFLPQKAIERLENLLGVSSFMMTEIQEGNYRASLAAWKVFFCQ